MMLPLIQRPLFSGNLVLLFFLFFISVSMVDPTGILQLHAADKNTLAADLVQDGQAIDLNSSKYKQLFTELKDRHHFEQEELDRIFSSPVISKRVLELMDKQWESKPYYQYASLFLTPGNIEKGKQKLLEHKGLLDKIEQQYGVDREIIIAIWGIETQYGSRQGSFNVFQTLNTLFDAYPRRSQFFRTQLIHFLLLCRENNVDPLSISGSYAGAFGQTQFIPSSFRTYGVSFDGDNKIDTWNSIPDILASIANYLKNFDWTLNGPIYAILGHELKDPRLISAHVKGRKGRVSWDIVKENQTPDLPPSPENRDLSIVSLELPPDAPHSLKYVAGYPNFIAITKWNNSNRYAMAVTELAEAFKN